MANRNQVECLSNCYGEECLACNEAYKNDVDNCPCRKNCPGEINRNFISFIKY